MDAVPTTQASLSHFFMKLFLAAPESFLPSALTAFGAHASRLHFFRKLLRAAPASGLPFLSIALLAHVSCAIAGPIAKAAMMAAKTIPFMGLPPVGQPVVYSKNCRSQQPQYIARQRRHLRFRPNGYRGWAPQGIDDECRSCRAARSCALKQPFAADYQFGGRFSMNARTPS